MRVAILPEPVQPDLLAALDTVGAQLCPVEEAEAVIWVGDAPEELDLVLQHARSVRWVQLASAGVEGYLPLIDDRIRWTRAAGVQAGLVAEHALMLALTVLRGATASIRGRAWLPQPAVPLTGSDVLIVGGGAVACRLLELLHPFRVRAFVLRQSGRVMAGAAAVNTPDRLDDWLRAAHVVFLTAPLTPKTAGLVNEARLRVMRPDACLINVSRGGLIVTDDLVHALMERWIAGAGLDVTEPEPLPTEHPLWSLPNCVITAHSAGDQENSMGEFADLVGRNIRLLARGLEPIGLIDPTIGY